MSRRLKKILRLFGLSLVNSRGVAGKWAMILCLIGWVRTRVGYPGPAKEVTLHIGDVLVDVDIFQNEILPYWEIWCERSYDALPQFRPTRDGVVVDVGGNVGFYAVRQAQLARAGRVIVFEPSPAVFRRLRRNLEQNGLAHALAVNAAVSGCSGRVYFVESPMSINCRVVPVKSDRAIEVQSVTLDDAMTAHGIERIDLLKIDTEGHERDVLWGAQATLGRVARIVIELHGDIREEGRVIDSMLRPAGFGLVAQRGRLAFYERCAEGVQSMEPGG